MWEIRFAVAGAGRVIRDGEGHLLQERGLRYTTLSGDERHDIVKPLERIMNPEIVYEIACAALLFGMLLVSNIGHRFGRRRLERDDTISDVSGAIIAAMFALLGLLIAFTFSGAYSRFDARRQLIVKEANAISTAYLRLGLLPAHEQALLQEKFREYAASRAALYEKLSDNKATVEELAKAATLQKDIWTLAVAASSSAANPSVRMLLLPALNEMIDIVTIRTVAIGAHPPVIIFLTLSGIALICAGLTGYRGGKSIHPGQIYYILLAIVTAYVLFLILDIEYPRHGLVRLEKANRVLVELEETLR